MIFSHASLAVNSLDGLYSALVAFVVIGVVFAVLRLLPRPAWARRKSAPMLAARLTGLGVLIVAALMFGMDYTSLISFS